MSTRNRVRHWRYRRDTARGRRDIFRRAGDQVRSKVPLYRDRLNSRTGWPHRRDTEAGRRIDGTMRKLRESREVTVRERRAAGLDPGRERRRATRAILSARASRGRSSR